LVTTDLVADNVATPALFLIHRESHKAIVVSAWPSIAMEPQPLPAAPAPVATFDPGAFFSRAPIPMPSPLLPSSSNLPEVAFIDKDGSVSRLHCSSEPEGGMLWTLDGSETRPVEELGISFNMADQFTLQGPFGYATMADPMPGPMQRWLVCGLVALALEHGVRVQRSAIPTVEAPSCDVEEGESSNESSPVARSRRGSNLSCCSNLSSGDHVEVQYKGSWLRGVLQDISGDVAQIQCDVDRCGVTTRAPLDRVRPLWSVEGDFNIEFEGLEAESEDFTKGFGQC